jgi:hypothetical protein
VRAQHAPAVGAHDRGPHPHLLRARRIRGNRRGAAGRERLEQATLRRHGDHAGRVGHGPEQGRQRGVAGPALHGQSTLAGRREHLLGLEHLGDGVETPDPVQADAGQHYPVQIARVHHAQPGIGVTADRHAAQVTPQGEQLRDPAWRAGPDPGPGRKVGELGAVPGHQRVPRVIPGRYRGQHDARHGTGRQVLQ